MANPAVRGTRDMARSQRKREQQRENARAVQARHAALAALKPRIRALLDAMEAADANG